MRTNQLRSGVGVLHNRRPQGEGKSALNPLATARGFLERGWQPVPVPHGQKSPELRGWPQLEITASNINDYFDQRRQNIGVKLGSQSGGLTDIDLDCVEAVVLADELLPETSGVFGRESKRSSHWLYVTDLCKSEQKAVIKFVEPPALACDPGKPATLVELRIGGGDKGTQTLFPGSIHPSGEPIEWDRDGEPAHFDGGELKRVVGALAAGALLARHYPATGARHDAALVLGGVLARIPDMEADDIETFVTAIARAADDDEAQERGRSAAGAVELLERGDPTPGLPRMRELWGTELADTVAKWLNFTEAPAPSDELIDKLARLKLIQYDQQRSSAAATLGIRAATLDKVVAGRRGELGLEGAAEFLPTVEPWHESVDGAELLDRLCEVVERHVVLPKGASTAIALWILHCHAHDAAQHSPILDISSPTKRCGKTNLLATITMLVPKPLSAANVTPATIFRAIEHWHPTLLIDETDTFMSDKSELRGVLNSGHTRSQAYVVRCVGEDLIPKQFSSWSPKAFAHIGRIHPTLEDRSIGIGLKRKLRTEKTERIPRNADAYEDLRRQCARWAQDQLVALSAANPALPEINDRARDNWEPLLAIAEACDSEWGEYAREIAVQVSGEDDDETFSIQLMHDLKALFERAQHKNLASAFIAGKLGEMEQRPWPEFNRGQPITTTGIAKLLKPFKIRPKQVVIGSHRVQGYQFQQFKWAFARYIPDAQLK